MSNPRETSLTKSTIKVVDQYIHFHNGTAITSFFQNPKVDTFTKLVVDIGMTYTSSKKEDIKDKFFKQNTHLKDKYGLRAEHSTSTIQKALKRTVSLGVVDKIYFIDSNGEYVSWEEKPGLTERHIVPNMKKVLHLLKTIPSDESFKQLRPRGNERRTIYQRPFSIVEELIEEIENQLTKEKVTEINARKKKINAYLETQLSRYSDFA